MRGRPSARGWARCGEIVRDAQIVAGGALHGDRRLVDLLEPPGIEDVGGRTLGCPTAIGQQDHAIGEGGREVVHGAGSRRPSPRRRVRPPRWPSRHGWKRRAGPSSCPCLCDGRAARGNRSASRARWRCAPRAGRRLSYAPSGRLMSRSTTSWTLTARAPGCPRPYRRNRPRRRAARSWPRSRRRHRSCLRPAIVARVPPRGEAFPNRDPLSAVAEGARSPASRRRRGIRTTGSDAGRRRRTAARPTAARRRWPAGSPGR